MKRNIFKPPVYSEAGKIILGVLYLAAVIFMANLSALTDLAIHPEIPYFDEEHLIVGGVNALVTILLFGALILHTFLLRKTLYQQEINERELTESEEKYRSLFEESKDAVYIEAADGHFLDINPAGWQLFGYDSREEALEIDIPHDLYVNPKDWDIRQDVMERKGFVEGYEIELKKKTGEHVFVLETANAMRDGEGRIVSCRGMMRDITMQRQLESKVLHAEKMESIGRMAGGLAHDFNNHLTIISGQAELALNLVDGESPLGRNLDAIRSAVQKASSLTRQLMLFSRSQPLNIQPVELNTMVTRSAESLSRKLKDGIDVSVRLDPGLVTVEADRGNMELVIETLAISAAGTFSDRGRIAISTENIRIDESYSLTHAEAYPGNFACITLSDDGEGMADETVTHLFEPFFGSRRDDPNGMAMAVAYGIIMQHGGWIEVESAEGMGSEYRIFLPASIRAIPSKESGSGVEALRGSGQRILLVEDEEAVRETIERMLHDSGYSVLAAENAEQAFDLFVSEAGNIELVLSDVVLPGGSGADLATNLRVHNGRLPVILSSGYADNDEDLHVINDNDYRFLQKPFTLPDLLKTIKELLN